MWLRISVVTLRLFRLLARRLVLRWSVSGALPSCGCSPQASDPDLLDDLTSNNISVSDRCARFFLLVGSSRLDQLGFSPPCSFRDSDWEAVPDVPGVYVVFDGDEVVYIGMAGRNGKGSLRRRLADHASGQVVNMFVQYLLFDRILPLPEPPRSPSEAKARSRAYILQNCAFRFLPVNNRLGALRMERQLKRDLQPTFNRTAQSTATNVVTVA